MEGKCSFPLSGGGDGVQGGHAFPFGRNALEKRPSFPPNDNKRFFLGADVCFLLIYS